ncbi:AsmA family protein, partial [Aduncisulcus paluster]
EAYGMKAQGALVAKGFNSNSMNFSGDMSIPGFNLKETLDEMGMGVKTADSKALTSVGMDFNYAGTNKSVEIKDLQVNLDGTTIKGLLSFANPERPDIVAQLGIDKINKKSVEPKEELLPVDLLRKLTLKADLNIKELIAKKAKVTEIVVRARAKDGVLTVKPASFNVAKGAFTSSAVVDVRGKDPLMSVTAGLTGLDGADLSQQMTGEDKFSGH